jgi:excinuclease ABC subunit C
MAHTPQDGGAKARLFSTTSFDGFGPSRFRPDEERVVGRQLRSTRPGRLRKAVREHAPRAPGVYGMIDGRGRLVYVGKAKNLRVRLLSYFRTNSRDPKAGKIIRHTRILLWEEVGDEFAALLRELELIQTHRPRFNVLGIPGLQRHHYLCLGKSPAAHVYISSAPNGKELGVYGPLVRRSNTEDAARRINDWFRLRDCPQTVSLAFADQPELFPEPSSPKCLRFELGTCRGPCVAACSRAEYAAGVRAAKAFLDGRDRAILAKLKEMMEEAAQSFQFEKAMALRDRLQSLEWIDARLALLREARNHSSFVYPLAGHDGRMRWYLIHRGQVRAVCFAPTTPEERGRSDALLAATFTSDPGDKHVSVGAVDSVLLVVSWFRRNSAERRKLISKSRAIRILAG